MLTNTTQVSLKGALQAMITWKTFTMQKSSTLRPSKKQDIYHIVMTPDRIPKFTIPSLDVERVLHLDPMEDVVDFDTRSTIQQVALSPRTKRSHSKSNIKTVQLFRGSCLCKKASDFLSGDLDKVVDDSDPSTRAALSLPHLSKIKTPYGFLTLGESPNIRRKESLYFDVDPIQTPTALSMKNITRSFTTSPLQKQVTCKPCPNIPKKPARSLSLEVLSCTSASSLLSSSTSLEGCSSKCEKKKFRLLKWKLFAGGRNFKCNEENKEKVSVTVGRTRSNPIA